MKTKKKFRLWIVIRNIVVSIAAVFFMWIVIHQIMTAYEQHKYPPLGQLVEVDGKNMHVYSKGQGEHTIVLLSGLGTAAPALDFEPLMNEMAKNDKVVVVEPFGYGWSDVTNKERTVKNIVEEIRTALKKADIEGPYILMPHSVSGIYSMYYANMYRDEVKAVIGIDPTLPKALEYFDESAPSMPQYMSFAAPTGIARLALYMIPDDFLPVAEKGTYSDENLHMTKALSAWKLGNKNIAAETNEMTNSIDKTVTMSFPSDMPVLIFTTKEETTTEDGKSNITFYKEQLHPLTAKSLVVLEGITIYTGHIIRK